MTAPFRNRLIGLLSSIEKEAKDFSNLKDQISEENGARRNGVSERQKKRRESGGGHGLPTGRVPRGERNEGRETRAGKEKGRAEEEEDEEEEEEAAVMELSRTLPAAVLKGGGLVKSESDPDFSLAKTFSGGGGE